MNDTPIKISDKESCAIHENTKFTRVVHEITVKEDFKVVKNEIRVLYVCEQCRMLVEKYDLAREWMETLHCSCDDTGHSIRKDIKCGQHGFDKFTPTRWLE